MVGKFFLNILIVLILASCSTSSVVVNIQRPADITVSKDIQNVVIVNRSLPSKDNLRANIIEGMVSGEDIGADRKGSEYCIQGLSNMLDNSERFTLKNVGGLDLKGTGTSSFPIPLDWNEIKSICGSYQADALLVLETFDSDSEVFMSLPITRTKKVKGKKVKKILYSAELVMEIESGWRIYDMNKQIIVDENKFKEIKRFSAIGDSPQEAEFLLPAKRKAIKEAGLFAGKQYGFRISPIWIRRNRKYYSGKYDNLKEAKEYIKKNDWESAIAIWMPLTESSDLKLAGRSAFNMALASEVNGSLDAAIEWVKKAEKLGENKSSNYLATLLKRKKDEIKLQKQLNN